MVGLGLSGGGFQIADRHIAGLAAWLVVVALIVFGAASSARIGRPLFWIAGLLGSLVIWSALSSFWSGSVELSVIEADRVLVYLGFFLAAFLLAQTNESRERFAEGIAIGIAIVVLAGLGSRLLPHVIEVTDGLGSGSRLRYPLGYWNANATICAIAVAMQLWMSRGSRWSGLRWLSVALIPATLLTLYFTYSRGGLITLAVACVCLLALSADRLWLLATLAIGGLGALPALLAVQARQGLADNSLGQATVDQGATVLLILLAGTALSLALFAALRRLERGSGSRTDRAVSLSRDPVLLKRIALVAALVAVVAVALVGGRAWDQFSSSEVQVLNQNPAQHYSNLSGTGRHDYWRVAVDAFEEEPLIGQGAGTYVFSWNEHRSIFLPAIDAHSLYLEAFAELGVVGGLIVLGLVLGALWVAFAAWRAAPPERREAQAALLAAMVAFAIAAGFDWFWEIAALGAVFFLAAGAMAAARCVQLDPAGSRRQRSFGLAIVGLALAWVAALALIGPLLVEREINSSKAAADRGDLTSAAGDAKTARSIEPWAASPYVQLGLVAEQAGEYGQAAEEIDKAIEREDRNWVLYALRSRIHRENDEPAAARQDFEEARRLNPLAPREQLEGE